MKVEKLVCLTLIAAALVGTSPAFADAKADAAKKNEELTKTGRDAIAKYTNEWDTLAGPLLRALEKDPQSEKNKELIKKWTDNEHTNLEKVACDPYGTSAGLALQAELVFNGAVGHYKNLTMKIKASCEGGHLKVAGMTPVFSAYTTTTGDADKALLEKGLTQIHEFANVWDAFIGSISRQLDREKADKKKTESNAKLLQDSTENQRQNLEHIRCNAIGASAALAPEVERSFLPKAKKYSNFTLSASASCKDGHLAVAMKAQPKI